MTDVEIFETSDIEDERKDDEYFDSDADTVDESIERSKLDAQKAFERFQYFPYVATTSISKIERGGVFNMSQRFEMLREEVNRLSEELEAQVVSDEDESKKKTFYSSEDANKTLSEAVLLKKRLEGLESDSRLRGLIDPEYRIKEMLSNQNEISSQIIADATLFSTSTALEKSSSSSSSNNNNHTLTYELYHNADTAKIREAEAMNDLELRIASLEKLLVQKEEDKKNDSSILSSIRKMENQMDLLRPQTLDALSRRMKTIVNEYESFSRRMSRARSKNGGVSNPIRAKKLSSALEKIDSYDKISASIPSLVKRLKTLRGLHEESATFSNRLSAIETRQNHALEDLERSEKLISDLEVAMRENMKTIAKNIEVLDTRLDKLK